MLLGIKKSSQLGYSFLFHSSSDVGGGGGGGVGGGSTILGTEPLTPS